MARLLRAWRLALLATVAGLVAGCVGPAEPKWASDAEVARAAYAHDGPPRLTLFTVINNRTGSGAHSGLLINADQRVLYDPAGTWYHPQLPERNDVHFGMSPEIVDFYVDYHTRTSYRTVIQEIEVTPEVARIALQRALEQGAAPKGQCAYAISGILRDVPGFGALPRTWFPRQLSRAFGQLPEVRRKVVRDTDPDDNSGVIEAPPALYLRGLRAHAPPA